MVRSGLQKDVIDLYRRGLRNVLTKPPSAQPDFLLHLRYSFHHPKLRRRDYSAIEHQLRRFSRTIEMLESDSVKRMSVTSEMRDWWEGEVGRVRGGLGGGEAKEGEGV